MFRCLICCFYTTHNKCVTVCKKWGIWLDMLNQTDNMTTSKQILKGNKMNKHYFIMIEKLAANRGLAEMVAIAKQGTILHQALEKQTTFYSGARSAKEHKQVQDLIDSRKADIELQIRGIAEKVKPFIIDLQKEKIYI